jgi:hypothetical protein
VSLVSGSHGHLLELLEALRRGRQLPAEDGDRQRDAVAVFPVGHTSERTKPAAPNVQELPEICWRLEVQVDRFGLAVDGYRSHCHCLLAPRPTELVGGRVARGRQAKTFRSGVVASWAS